MLYVVICKKPFILLVIYAGTLSVLICTGVFIMAMAFSKCAITELAFSELKAVAHLHSEYVNIVWWTYFDLSNSAK